MDATKAQDNGRTRRLTVRLDAERVGLLQRLSQRTGSDDSHVIRAALDRYGILVACEAAGSNPRAVSGEPRAAVGQPVASGDCRPKAPPAPQPAALPPTAVSVQQARAVEAGAKEPDPGKIAALLPHYKAFGAEIWNERRRLYLHLFCTSLLAQENSDNPRDRQLHNELFRIGREYGLFN